MGHRDMIYKHMALVLGRRGAFSCVRLCIVQIIKAIQTAQIDIAVCIAHASLIMNSSELSRIESNPSQNFGGPILATIMQAPFNLAQCTQARTLITRSLLVDVCGRAGHDCALFVIVRGESRVTRKDMRGRTG